jgi:triphosphoribosyl-dephospho-CoA synthase
MALLEDSCLLSRGGPEGLRFARRGAARALDLGGAGSAAGRAEILSLDGELCARNLSPGGSADMLAAGIFLVGLETRFEAVPGRGLGPGLA